MGRSIVISTALALLLGLPGCAAPLLLANAAPAGAAAARAGAASFVGGELRIARKASLEDAWQAVHEALGELELDIKVQRTSDRRRYVMARDDDAWPEIRIQLDRRSPVLTRFSIRVGVFGDVAVSRAIVKEIDKCLVDQAR